MDDISKLKASHSKHNRYADIGAGVLFFGLALEVMVALWFPGSTRAQILSIMVVTVGFLGEWQFTRKAEADSRALQSLSDERIAATNERAALAEQAAAEAKLELQKFRAARSLPTRRQERIARILRRFSGTPFDMAINANEPEQRICQRDIERTLVKAGWQGLSWAAPVQVIAREGRPQIAVALAAENVFVGVSPEHMPELSPAARTLAANLKAAGIEAISGMLNAGPGTSANKAVHILIGRKS